jgi:DNA polymerase V
MDDLHIMAVSNDDGVSVHTGFPNPALDRRGRSRPLALDLNQLLIRHPSSTYLFRLEGHAWADIGLYDGDLAVIDRALLPTDHDLLLVWQDSGFAVCRRGQLQPEDSFWGVITATVHRTRPEHGG